MDERQCMYDFDRSCGGHVQTFNAMLRTGHRVIFANTVGNHIVYILTVPEKPAKVKGTKSQ